MARAVVTGGAGFLGFHLCDRLLRRGYEVVCVDNLATGAQGNVDHLSLSPGFALMRRDVSEHLDVDGPVDAVLHLASPASPPDYTRMPVQTLKAGSLGTHNALGLARAKGARFLLASTSEVYGDPQVHPQHEGYPGFVDPVGPRAMYEEAKRFAEAMTMTYHRHHGVDTAIARIFNTYGPRMRPDDGRVVSSFMVAALGGRPIEVFGDGSQTRSLCYVDDTVTGLLALLDSGVCEPVNIGNGTELSVLDLAVEVLALTGSQSPIVHRAPAPGDPVRRRPDTSRALKLLGWRPEVSLTEGLERTMAWFRSVRSS